jgi:hypothetical protein
MSNVVRDTVRDYRIPKPTTHNRCQKTPYYPMYPQTTRGTFSTFGIERLLHRLLDMCRDLADHPFDSDSHSPSQSHLLQEARLSPRRVPCRGATLRIHSLLRRGPSQHNTFRLSNAPLLLWYDLMIIGARSVTYTTTRSWPR